MIPEVRRDGLKPSENRIDEVCDAFEAVWLRKERPRINLFVEEVEQALQANLFYELLLVELEYRQKQGEWPTRDDYRREFPRFAEQIEAVNFHHGASAFATSAGSEDDTVRIKPRQPGSRIDHYELQERLGAGAMGEVWKAWDARLSRPVAIKVPRAEALSEADLRRFQREARAAAQLRHPQLASVYDVGRDGETAYIVADYVEGENLRQYLGTQRLSYQEMAQMCAEISEALHHAHELGIVHRDLKPANIIIDRVGRPHVIDFGLAKWSSEDHDLTVQGEVLGTPAYMSPEQANGDVANTGRATDVYSLGVILYEMISGRCPFTGDRGSVIHQILSRTPAMPRTFDVKIPRDLETICAKALEKEPARRYATSQEMAVDLRRFSRGEPILARRASPLEKSWRWLRHRPMVAVASALAFLALGAAMMARTADEKNRELLGYKHVELATDPPGATVAFARLGEGGELLPEQVTKPGGVTPVDADLLSGDYFIEVLWPDGRFHQIFRHVPRPSDSPANSLMRSCYWQVADNGTVVLPNVRAPKNDTPEKMIEVRLPEHLYRASPSLQNADKTFLVDANDFTNGQAVESNRSYSYAPATNEASSRESFRTVFARALDLAESSGKRLCSNIEYQCLLEKFDDAHSADLSPPSSAQSEILLYRPAFDTSHTFRCVRSTAPRFLNNQ